MHFTWNNSFSVNTKSYFLHSSNLGLLDTLCLSLGINHVYYFYCQIHQNRNVFHLMKLKTKIFLLTNKVNMTHHPSYPKVTWVTMSKPWKQLVQYGGSIGNFFGQSVCLKKKVQKFSIWTYCASMHILLVACFERPGKT